MFSKDQFGVNYFITQNNMIWGIDEFNLDKDVSNYHKILSDDDRKLITNILRFFTRSDEHVESMYQSVFPKIFNRDDELGIRMMFTAFANMESTHILAYSHLTETLGFKKEFYSDFLNFEYTKAKEAKINEDKSITSFKDLILFSLCYEGISLFGMFILLISYELAGLLPEIGRIIALSMRDENLHVQGMIDLIKYAEMEHIKHEYPSSGMFEYSKLEQKEVYNDVLSFVVTEKQYVKNILADVNIENLNSTTQNVIEKIYKYLDWLGKYRLAQLFSNSSAIGLIKDHCPYKWLPVKWEYEHINFFNSTVTEYQKCDNINDPYKLIDEQ